MVIGHTPQEQHDFGTGENGGGPRPPPGIMVGMVNVMNVEVAAPPQQQGNGGNGVNARL